MSEGSKYVDADAEEDELEPEEALEELLEEIGDAFGLDVRVEVEQSAGVLSGRVKGEDVGLFIGRRGQTIDAVQHLAQRIVFPGGPSRSWSTPTDTASAARSCCATTPTTPPRRRYASDMPWSLTPCHHRSDGSSTNTYASAEPWRRTARGMSPSATSSWRRSTSKRQAECFT
jgi:predicted RNA-binding protein YlqC (UPF0109 family)